MNIDTTVGNIHFKLNTSRFDRNFEEAQKKLNMQITADCSGLIPFQQGQLRSQVRYPEGLGGSIIEYYAPYAHYQYMGELYLDKNGRSYAEKYDKKYPSGKLLNHHASGTTDHWFEEAKERYGDDWERLVRQIGGKG